MGRLSKWRDTIQYAADETAVAALLNEYVSGIVPSELGALPLQCQVLLSSPVADIESTAVTLLQADLHSADSPEAKLLLHEVAQVYCTAAIKLGRLRSRLEPTPTAA